MKEEPGQTVVETLGGQDLNLDGSVINLAIVGSSRFYDFEIFESALEEWISENTYPDLIIVGGASGVDYMAERWTDNNLIPIATQEPDRQEQGRGPELSDREDTRSGHPHPSNAITDE